MFIDKYEIYELLSDMFDAIMGLICYLLSYYHKRDCVNIIEHFSNNKTNIIMNSKKNNQNKYD